MADSEVEVRVVDRATGAPIAGAEVGLFFVRTKEEWDRGLGDEPTATLEVARTDASGRCVAPVDRSEVAAGEGVDVIAVVRARGHSEWKSEQLRRGWSTSGPSPRRLLRRGGRVSIDVALDGGTTIEGTVSDSSGRPVANVRVGLVLAGVNRCSWPYAFSMTRSTHWPPSCSTDERGRYEWLSFPVARATEPDEHFALHFQHDDFRPALVQRVEQIEPDESGVVRADVVLERGLTLTGTIRTPAGAPAAGAIVTLDPRRTADTPTCVSFDRHVECDANGRYVVNGLQASSHRLEVAASGCAPLRREVDLTRGAPSSLDLQLEPGCDLVGRVVDRHGRPVANGSVAAFLRDPLVFRRAHTDADGRFELHGFPLRGRVELRAEPYVKVEVELPCETLTLREPPRAALELRLVADEDGRPLEPPGSVVVLGPGFSTRVELERNGVARLPNLPASHYEFWACAPDRALARLGAELQSDGSAAPIEIRVKRGGVARGRVTDPNGKPIANVQVTAYGELPDAERHATTDADGAYEVRGLGDGAGLVFVADGFALRAQPVEETGTPDRPVVVDVAMRVGATVRGRVVDADGAPAVRTLVKATLRDAPFAPFALPSSLTDEQGRFRIDHLPQAPLVVSANGVTCEVETSDGADLEVEIAPPPRSHDEGLGR